MKHGSMIDYVVLAAYFVILIGIGFYFSKMMKGGKDYFSGGNKIPWWASGISLYMSNFSAWTFTGAAGFAYFTGWFGMLYFLTWSIGFLIGSQLAAAKWRRSRVISPVEYTRTRYNKTTQQVIGYVIVLNSMFSLGVGLAAVSKVISASMNIDITLVIILSGIVILFYTYVGGLWAVAIADVVQFVILIAIILVILPLSLNLVGGIGGFLAKADPLNLTHVYKGEKFDTVYLIAIVILQGLAAMYAGQRYYCVKNEKDAKKVGWMSGLLFLTAPILFGVPPMVAKIIWPDLSVIPFFQGQNVPTESVFIGIVLTVLPNGLIGMFMAAMFAATMSTIDSMYNFTAAVVAKDLYAGVFKHDATDKQIMKVGKVATFIIGIFTIGTAIVYAKSQFGFFNWTLTFISLFYVPMTLPLVFGLLIQRLPRWSGLATILLGLVMSIVTRFVLGFSFGDQIITVVFFCSAILFTADLLRYLYKNNKIILYAYSIFFSVLLFIIFRFTAVKQFDGFLLSIVIIVALGIGATMIYFAKLFAEETDQDRAVVAVFFDKLRTPIDLIKEVYSKGVKEVSTFPMVGKITMLMGALVSLLTFFGMTGNEIMITLLLGILMIFSGYAMVYFGGRSERKYLENMQKELGNAGIKIKSEE
jgi:solute:Na+ symporter, SSS family